MEFILQNYWEVFITLEVLSIVSLLLFGVVRYLLGKKKTSLFFIVSFLVLLILEALLSFVIYKKTGEFSTFQIVIVVFVLYACTFGIGDFKRLDRWMRFKIGKWKGVELLTEKDYDVMERNQDPKYIAKKYRLTSTIHLLIFVIVQAIFWNLGTSNVTEMVSFLKDFSWLESGDYIDSPYSNETLYSIGIIWAIVFFADFVWSWSYTIFPSQKN